MTNGIHHVTAITRKVQANVDFYAGFLGLRLVKRSAGYEDGEQLHLFYGDALGSPGSLVTFLVWEDGAPGRVGHGQVAEIALAVPPDSIGDWLTRAISAHVPVQGPMRELGETVLRLKDPDGVTLKLVGIDMPALAPLPDPIAPTRLRGVTLFTEMPVQTREFLARFGYATAQTEGAITRMTSDSDVIDIRDATGYFPGIPGTGVMDHVALRAPGLAAVQEMRDALAAHGPTQLHDRKYFTSLYVRDPAGILLEYATDGPGFTVDETPADLGRILAVPPHDLARSEDLRVVLPQFALPGEPRPPLRDMHFVHRLFQPEAGDGSAMVLLHGSGGSESDLMPLAHRIAPQATLLGVRGRSTEEGISRWFRRYGPDRFDQADIRAEAEAFAAFLSEAARQYDLDPARMTCIGYSNGANLLGAVLQLFPQAVGQAILMRARQVLDPAPDPLPAALTASRVLMLNGAQDPHGTGAAALAASLTGAGAALQVTALDQGHDLAAGDEQASRDWLAQALTGQIVASR